MANINDIYNNDNIKRGLLKILNINNSLSYDKELLNQYVPSSSVDENSLDIDFSSERSNNIHNAHEQEESKGIFRTILEGTVDTAKFVGESFLDGSIAKWNRIKNGNPVDVWRMTFEKAYQVMLDSEEKKLYDANKKLELVEISKQYAEQLLEVSNLRSQFNKSVEYGYPEETINNLSNLLTQSIERLDLLESYIKDNWKDSDIFYDLFVDKNKELSFKDSMLALLYEIAPDKNIKWRSDEEKKNRNAVSNFLHDNLTGTLKFLSGTTNVLSTAINDALNLAGLGENSVRRAMRNLPEGNTYFDYLFDSYKSETGGIKDNINNKVRDLQRKTDEMFKTYEREVRERQAEVIHTHNVYKNGNFLFDPKKISSEFRKEQEKERGLLSIFDLTQMPYNLPELGTSFSDVADFLGLMGLNTAGSVTSEAIARSTIAATPVGRGLKVATGAATVLGGLYFSKEMRQNESNAEVTGAWSSRLLDEIKNSDIDLKDILNQGRQFLNKRGIDTSDDNNLETLQLMLAFDVPTTDDVFNNLKNQTRKGLAKVYNDNNTLSTLDYIQALPFMNYSGSIIRKTLGSVGKKSLMSPAAQLGKEGILEAAYKSATSMSDNLIQTIANKYGKDLSSKLKIYHGSKYIKNKIKKMIPTMLSEGIEEGQLTLLQERYKRGLYDEYEAPESMFYIPSILEDAMLASDAVSSYLGINFGDPDNGSDELRRAMNVGAITAMFFPMSHAITNIINTKEDNIRNTIAQMKSDKIIRNIVGENYGKAQDDDHVGIFFDSFSKFGTKADELELSLLYMKLFKGDLVSDEFVDGDIQLMRETYNVYHNPALKPVLKELGISEGDKTHRAFVQRAVRNIIDSNTANDANSRSIGELNALYRDVIDHLLDEESQKSSTQQYMLKKIEEKYNEYLKTSDVIKNKSVNNAVEKRARQNLIDLERSLYEGDDESNEKDYDIKLLNEIDRIKQNPEEFSEIISEIEDNTINKNSFIERYLTNLLESKNLKNAQTIRKTLLDQKARQDLIRRETGTDIDTTRLSAIIDRIDEYIAEIKDAHSKFFNDANEQIDKYNNAVDVINKNAKSSKKLKKRKHLTVDDYFREVGEFDNIDEINRLLQISFLNNAVSEILNAKSSVYKYGIVDPTLIYNFVRPSKWKELSNEQKNEYINNVRNKYQDEGRLDEFKGESTARALYNNDLQTKKLGLKKIRNKYQELQKQIKDTPEQGRSIADEKDLLDLLKQAAVEFMRYDLDDKLNRMKIAHRERELEKPITTDEIEASLNGDEVASNRIQDKIDQFEQLNEDQTEDTSDENVSDSNSPIEQSSLIGNNYSDDSVLMDLIDDNPSESDVLDRISKNLGNDKRKTEKLKRIAKHLIENEKSKQENQEPANKEVRSEEQQGLSDINVDVVLEQPLGSHTEGVKDIDDNKLELYIIDTISDYLDSLDIINNLNNYNNTGVTPLTTLSCSSPSGFFDVISTIRKAEKADYNSEEKLVISTTRSDNGGIIKTGFHIPKNYLFEDDNIDREKFLIYEIRFIYDGNIPTEITAIGFNDGKSDIAIIRTAGVIKIDKNPIDETSTTDRNVDNSTGLLKNKDSENTETYDDNTDGDNGGTKEEDLSLLENNNKLEYDPLNPIESSQDLSKFGESEDGLTITFDDQPLDLNVYQSLQDEQDLLLSLDSSLDLNLQFGKGRNTTRRSISDKQDVISNYIEQTFFYQPDAKEPMVLSVGEKQLVVKEGNNYILTVNNRKLKVQSGSKFSKMLVKRGWFDKCNKFYIVSQGSANTDRNNPDGFTITLAVEDKNTGEVYLSALRTPGKYSYKNARGEEIFVNNENKLKQSLREIGVDYQKYSEFRDDQIISEHATKFRKRIKDVRLDEARDWYYKLDKNDPIKYDIEYRSRLQSKKPGAKRIFTEEQIDDQIIKLKNARNEIIDSYCNRDNNGNYIIPTEVRDDIKPADYDTSNGIIENVRSNVDLPVFRNISGLNGGFGIANNTEDIENQLLKSEIQFGFGTGNMWYVDPNDRNIIKNVLDINSDLQFDGNGIAGKIYIIVTSNNGNKVPILLSEQKFNAQQKEGKTTTLSRKRDNIILGIDNISGKIDKGVTPSAAEVLLYLLTDRLHTDELPNSNRNLSEVFANMFINNGDKTILNGNRILNVLTYYADKLIAIQENLSGEKVLTICKKSTKNGNTIRYRKSYTMNELFGNDSEEIRKDVIYTIAENMHWNTDINSMRERMDKQLLSELQKYFTKNPNATEYRLAGVDLFSFKKEDLFYEENGKIKPKNITVLAWMIKSGKLMTDVSKNIFKDPFVYAKGVATSTLLKEIDNLKQKQVTLNKPEPSIVEAAALNLISYEDYIDSIINKIDKLEKSISKKDFVSRTEDRKKQILDEYNELFEENRVRFSDIIALSLPNTKNSTKLKEAVIESVKNYIKEANKSRSADNQLLYEDINISDINDPYIDKFIINKIPVLFVSEGKKGSVLSLYNPFDVRSMYGITGVFSKHRGLGKLNSQQAKSWLKKTLGLDDSQVLILNGLIKASEDEVVYGVMNTSLDILSDTIKGNITLSEQAGSGVHYHEAWHYVNLLLHTSEQRLNIYKEYVKQHPELRKAKFSEIEEQIAEEFRKYMEDQNSDRFIDKIKRWFKNVIKFIGISRDKGIMHTVFNKIKNGDYANLKLDEQSLQEFRKAYPDGATKVDFSIPGIKQDKLDELKGIKDYNTFYKCGISLANKLLYDYNLSTPEEIRSINGELFDSFILKLKSKIITEPNPLRKQIIRDIVNNPQLFKNIVVGVFKQYGLEPKFKRFKQLDENTNAEDSTNLNEMEGDLSATDIGERTDFTYDIENIKISKKVNVAFRAKLFLSMIEKSEFIPIEKQVGGKTIYEKEFTYIYDDLLGTPEFMSYSDCWNKILNDLWNCESYDDIIDGEYSRTSIRGIVKRLKASDSFYEALDRKLDQIENDIELQNQIYGTVKSSKPQIAYQELKDPILKRLSLHMTDLLDSDLLDEFSQTTNVTVADRERDWIMHDDNALSAKRNLPRRWSKTAVSSGLMLNGVVSIDFANATTNMLNSILNSIRKVDIQLKRNKKEYDESIFNEANANIEYDLLQLLNYMSIPFDELALDHYIQMHVSAGQNTSDPKVRFNAFKQIMNTGVKNPGNIQFIVNSISNSAKSRNNSVITIKGNKTKPIDQVYYGFKIDSEISKMAEAYNKVHPSSQEFSVVGPDGSTIYPISQNNYMSDAVRWLNDKQSNRASDMMKSPYATNSIILRYADNLPENPSSEDIIKLETFVGLKESKTRNGNDYFGITPMEDYLAKLLMTFKNRIILPTMADKKTWYALKIGNDDGTNLLPHDLITWDETNENGKYLKQTFSKSTLDIFISYLIDEFNSLEQYYSRDNIQYLLNNPGEIRENYHGNIIEVEIEGKKVKRMDFSGNGGKFRYFYDILKEIYGRLYNLNQLLEFEYNRQKSVESNPSEYGGVGWMREGDLELDGFELVREQIKKLRGEFFYNRITPRPNLYDVMNYHLMSQVYLELEELCKPGPLNMAFKDKSGKPHPYAIPSYILNYYAKQLKDAGYKTSGKAYRSDYNIDTNALLSAIANHVVSNQISIIEVEKVFTGDPAYYSWKNIKGTYAKEKITIDNVVFGNGISSYTTEVSNLLQKDVDKTKRLGAVLSPGQNLRIQYSELILKEHPELRGKKYTNINIADIDAVSVYLNTLIGQFTKQNIINYIRDNNPAWFKDFINNNKNITKGDFEKTIDLLYTDSKLYEKLLEIINTDYKYLYDNSIKNAKNQTRPYSGITVSDAQVFIRPQLYRKLRIGWGQWTFEEDETGYSDEKAYNIIEKDGSWQSDSEKYKLVQKLQLNVLKATYFMNDPYVISEGDYGKSNYQNIPVYNKMAIFPIFKFSAQSSSGKKLYDRMNMKDNELDMISFESAVKVGGSKYKYSPFSEKTDQIEKLNEELFKKSDHFISTNENNYGEPCKVSGDNLLAVQIQDLDGLRMLLNTEEHDSHERAIGTQMFKLSFSNIIDDTFYRIGKNDKKPIKGKDTKHDIMSCINAMTLQGVDNIVKRFYKNKNEIQVINRDAVSNMIKSIVKNNNIGIYAEEILLNGGTVSSMMARQVFEQSVFSAVSKEIIDINTPGGSAIQLSVFGFVGYVELNIVTQQNTYSVLNEGDELQWNTEDGSMEVMLSMNFFKEVVPREYQSDYITMRQWLIDNDIIKGTKTDGTKSKPKPFGLGYRIPTQGMSSIFSMIVADVLPELSSDTIVVPREFTAQTGSDYDVDKLFIATMSYTDGVYDELENADQLENIKDDKDRIVWYRKQNPKAVSNRLLSNYIDIVTDIKNVANARASIDTITLKIQDELLPHLKQAIVEYRPGMYELLPSFQSQRKMEFSVGKDGIGPFALNVTNLALTQYTHLCMDYGDNEFGFGKLDEIRDKDGLYISDWISAMVNAHVDVAKDPYVFTLNVNTATYKHVNFLLRVGKGLSTFTFIAQPALKDYCNQVTNSGGIYGQNIDGRQIVSNVYTGKNSKIFNSIKLKLEKELQSAFSKQKKEMSKEELKKWIVKINNITKNTQSMKKSDWAEVFDIEKGILAAKQYNSGEKTVSSIYFQLLALHSFRKMQPYCDELSNLVKVSRIDNKKFGNNIASHLNFKNQYEQFKFGKHKVKWYINDGTSIKDQEKFGKSYALRKYFGSLFLDTKFYNAIRYTREILNTQTYTATPIFEELFDYVLKLINGTVEYNKEVYINGKLTEIPVSTYKSISNEDVIKSVANSIDNIIRYRILSFEGPSWISKYNSNLQEDLSGPIDFTMNGDEKAVRDKMESLLFGTYEETVDDNGNKVYNVSEEPLFQRVSKFIHYIKQNPYSDYADGLVANGKLVNELLDFLNPQPANDKSPIGRLLLKESQMNLGFDKKMMLISAFDALLRHPQVKVRELARDIAFYAYYSTYDTNTVNSFFDLVPYEYRKQYDRSLSKGLYQSKDKLTQMLSALNDMVETDDTQSLDFSDLSSSILDLISRNYYYDDNIVPRFKLNTPTLNLNNSNFESNLVSARINKKRFPGCVITTYCNSPFFKVEDGGYTVLYKKISILKREKLNEEKNNKKGNKKYNPAYIYIATHKLGLHQGNTHQYEFLSGSQTESIFNIENQLPNIFNPVNLIGKLYEFIEAMSNKYPDIKFTKEKIYDIPAVSDNMFYETNNTVYSIKSNVDNSVAFLTEPDDERLQKESTVILDINSNEHNTNDKTVSVNQDMSVIDIVNMMSDKQNHGVQRIYVSGNTNMQITNEELNKFKNRQINKFKERLEIPEDISEAQREEFINSEVDKYVLENESKFELMCKQDKADQFIFDIINTYLHSNIGNIEIDTIYADGRIKDGETSVPLLAVSVGNTIMNMQLDLNRKFGYVLLDKKYGNPKNAEEALKIEEIFDYVNEDVVLSNQEIENIKSVQSVVDKVDELELDIVDAKQQKDIDIDFASEELTLDTETSYSVESLLSKFNTTITKETDKQKLNKDNIKSNEC